MDDPRTDRAYLCQAAVDAARKGRMASFPKRDFLIGMEQEIGLEWEERRLWEVDAPEAPEQPKFMVTSSPFTHVGHLHLLQVLPISKAEFAAGYQRLKGKRVLFPVGFHCTGMLIKSCAEKIRREMEEYGDPPRFPYCLDSDSG